MSTEPLLVDDELEDKHLSEFAIEFEQGKAIEKEQEENEEGKEEEKKEEGNEEEPKPESLFDDDITKIIAAVQEEKEVAPEVKVALELQAEIEQDQFIKNYLAAKKVGKSSIDYLRSVTESEYSEDNAERVHTDYLKKQFPTATAEQLEEEWYKFKNGEDNLTLSQKATIRTWASELNKDIVKPDFEGELSKKQKDFQAKEEARINKQLEEIETYTQSKVGKKLFADEAGKGGYKISKEDINEALSVMEAMADPKRSKTAEGTLQKWVFDRILKATLFDKALPTLLKTTMEEGQTKALSKAANLKNTASSSSSTPQSNLKKGESFDDIVARAREEFGADF